MRRIFSKMDKILLVLMIMFIVFGLIMVLSASSMESYMRWGNSPYYYFIKQLIFICIGSVLFLIITRLPTNIYKKVSFFAIIVSIISLVALMAYGYVSNNAASWFKIGPFSIQPSEFAKLAVIIFMASYYDKHKDFLDTQWTMIKPLLFIVPIVFLVAMQPDLGTSVVIVLITAFMFFSVPMKRFIRNRFNLIFLGAVGVIILVFVITKGSFLKGYQLQRLVEFADPCERYQEKSGYQVCNSLIAFKNGGVEGEGIGKSTQKYLYLPESYTDFIFPIIVEEWGLIVGILIIIFYLLIIHRLYVIAKKAHNLNSSMLAYGVCIYFMVHVIINLVGVMGIGPMTGIPLPFLSYGGSYTISLLLAFGIAQRVSIETKIEDAIKLKNIKNTKKSLA